MSRRKSQSPMRAYRRMVRADAQAQDKDGGCKCVGVTYVVKEDAAETRVTVIATGHSDDCVVVRRGVDVSSTPGADTPSRRIVEMQTSQMPYPKRPLVAPGDPDDGAVMVVESKLWTP